MSGIVYFHNRSAVLGPSDGLCALLLERARWRTDFHSSQVIDLGDKDRCFGDSCGTEQFAVLLVVLDTVRLPPLESAGN